MTLWQNVPADAGSLSGTNSFRLMPHDAFFTGPAGGTVRRAADGHGVVLDYTWEHAADGRQSGTLFVASPDDEGTVTAVWLDSWHQKPFPLVLTGSALDVPDGAGVALAATYAGTWGWQVDLRVSGEDDVRAEMTMRNVVPAEAIPADMAETMKPGPYDVAVLRLS